MQIRGVDLDAETRCAHYGTPRDIVAIRFGCCEAYYACFKCHEELASHPAEPWPTDRRNERAVYCGVCENEMTAAAYISAVACPNCESPFNPGCQNHYPLYFEWADAPSRDR